MSSRSGVRVSHDDCMLGRCLMHCLLLLLVLLVLHVLLLLLL